MASTLTAGDVFGLYQGYFPSFSAGSLSPDAFGGFTCTALITGFTAGRITANFSGDATAFLTGKAISVDGTPYSTIASGPTYDSGSNVTNIEWAYGPGNFTVGNSYSIDIGGGGPSYAGPTYVGKSTAVGGASSVSPDFTSSGRSSGDLLILAVETANQALSAPSGWTEVATYSPKSRGTAGAAGGVRLTLFQKTSDGTETTVATGDSGDHQYAVGFVFRGDSGAAVAIDVGDGNNVAATTSGSFGGVTTTDDDRLIAHFVATDLDSAAASWGTATNANLANLTERHDAGTTSGAGGGVALITGEKQAAGATGSTTSTQAASAAYVWITLALKNVDVGSSPTISTITAATISVTGAAMTTNAKKNSFVSAASILVAGQAMMTKVQKSSIVTAANIVVAGMPLITNAKRVSAVVAASILVAGQAMVTNAKHLSSAAAASISVAGQAMATLVSHRSFVDPAQVTLSGGDLTTTIKADTISEIVAAAVSVAGQTMSTSIRKVSTITRALIRIAGRSIKTGGTGMRPDVFGLTSLLRDLSERFLDLMSLSVPDNDTEEAYYLELARAAEAFAGVSPPLGVNANAAGHLLRAALALEAISTTTGAEENRTYEGLLKRAVDALEEFTGTTSEGSLIHRLRAAVYQL